MTNNIVIVGAGLAGCLLAKLLADRGHAVHVYERRPDPRAAGFRGGRSINLALSTRGISALKRAGLDEEVLADAIPMPGRMMHDPSGKLTYQPYSKDPREAINSVSRGGLNLTLLNAAVATGRVDVSFGHRGEEIDLDGGIVEFVRDTDVSVRVRADLIVGADGAFSAVRTRLTKTDRFNYEQRYLEHGYKELTIPPADGGGFAMEENALHIWPRGGSMMIALPNRDASFTCTLFWPFSGPHGFDQLRTGDDVRGYFERHFPDAVPLMPTLVEDYHANPVSSLVTVRCAPWHHGENVVLIGDAAHAVVPFYGQGMNAAFEDCEILAGLLDDHGGDWAAILPAFTAARKANADAIADLALDNFIEMRDKVGSSIFLIKKRGEQLLHRLLPGRYVPLYNMVTFTTIPYAEAQARARRRGRRWTTLFITIITLLIIALVTVAWPVAIRTPQP